jgi:hypothetical protein
MKKSTIIFDNAGGTILKLYRGDQVYCNHYMYVEQAVQDYYTFMTDTDTDLTDWEGHEEELVNWYPSYEDMKNGGYHVLDGEDLKQELESESLYGYNHESFIKGLKKLKEA